MEQLLWLTQPDYDIPAVFCVPDDASDSVPYPAVILCHGTGSHKDEVGDLFRRLAHRLVKQGIASLRLDFAGCGDSQAPQQVLTFLGEVKDVHTAYQYLQQCPNIDNDRIGILGFSQGARVMAQFLKEIYDPQMTTCTSEDRSLPHDFHTDAVTNQISTAVSWSGACHDGPGVFADWFALYYEESMKNGFARIPMGWRDDLLVSRQWFDEVRDSHPLEGFAAYPGPLLVIAGSADTVVPCEHTREILAHCRHPHSRGWILPGADHTFCVLTDDQTLAEAVLNETTCWFCQHL